MVKFVSYWCNYKFKYPKPELGEHHVEETYEYGMSRIDIFNPIVGVGLAKDIVDMEQLMKDTENDAFNGIYKGWVYSHSMTKRLKHSKMAILYATIDEQFISFWKNHTDAGPLLSLPTKHLHWPCVALEHSCDPEQYVKS